MMRDRLHQLRERVERDKWLSLPLQYLFWFENFVRRYWLPITLMLGAGIIGWVLANSVSNYTQGGWELHIRERFNKDTRVDLHIHHWFYGLPLYLVALLLIDVQVNASIFLFGLGQAISAHSFINEGGIPSIFEGGPTWRIPPEIYFPAVTALCFLYLFFLMRRGEWLARAQEREEIAMSYLTLKAQSSSVLSELEHWADYHLTRGQKKFDAAKQSTYGAWSLFDPKKREEWQLDYILTPYDDARSLLTVRLTHIPHAGYLGLLDDWFNELDGVLGDLAQPIVNRPQTALQNTAEVTGGKTNG